jgi:hypothetical protein
MTRYWHCVSLVALLGTTLATAQDPTFDLTFAAPSSSVGTAGSALQYTATGRLTTNGLTGADPGAQGWSISMAADGGGAIVGVTTDGTVAAPTPDGLVNGGFNKTELTTGAGNEGAVSAIVLSFTLPITLPPTGTVDIIKATVEATVPACVEDENGDLDCEPLLSRVFFVDGRRGSGQPVDNKVTYTGQTVLPSKGEAITSVCPNCPKPLVLRVDVLNPGSVAGEKSGATVPWTAFADGPTLAVQAGVTLISNLGEDDPGTEGMDGAQGWSMSILTEPCFNIASATTAGTAADTVPNGGFWDGGFNKTQVVDPAKNAGQQGAVSAIVLSFTLPVTLPPTSELLVLKVGGNMDASGLGDPQPTTPPCNVVLSSPSEPGLIGAGQPVKTAVTVAGNTKNPGTCHAAISLALVQKKDFIRGNANNDLKIDIADPVWIINELFRQGPASVCADAADANDDNQVDASDAVYVVTYLFQGGATPPAPFPDCGPDPTEAEEDDLGCAGRPLLCGG